MYIENHKALMKEIKEDTMERQLLFMKDLTLLKYSYILLKVIHTFSAIPIKIAVVFFTETEKNIYKIHLQYKRPYKARTILRK